MPYLLDADWAIQAMAIQPATLGALNRLSAQRMSVSIVVAGEIYEGAFNSSNPQARLDRYRWFLSQFRVLPVIDPIMEQFAETRAVLRRRGLLIPDFDLIVAATALHHNLTLLTYNRRHFERIPNLRLYRLREQ